MSHEASVRLDGRPVGSLTCLRVGIVLVFKLKVSGLYNAGVSCEHEKKKSYISLLLLPSLGRRLLQYAAQTLEHW